MLAAFFLWRGNSRQNHDLFLDAPAGETTVTKWCLQFGSRRTFGGCSIFAYCLSLRSTLKLGFLDTAKLTWHATTTCIICQSANHNRVLRCLHHMHLVYTVHTLWRGFDWSDNEFEMLSNTLTLSEVIYRTSIERHLHPSSKLKWSSDDPHKCICLLNVSK